MENDLALQRLLPDLKIEVEAVQSRVFKILTIGYITSPGADPNSWATACSLKPGDFVEIDILYYDGDRMFVNFGQPPVILNKHVSVIDELLTEGLAVIRSDASSLPGFDNVAPRLRACQALAQVWRRGLWKDWQISPTSTLAVGTHSMAPSGRSVWQFDFGLCSMKHRVAAEEATVFCLVAPDRGDHFELLSIRVPISVQFLVRRLLSSKLAKSPPPLLTFLRSSYTAPYETSVYGFERSIYSYHCGPSISGNMNLEGEDIASMLVDKGLAIPVCSTGDPALLTPYEKTLLELHATAISEKRGVHVYSQSVPAGLNNISETNLTAVSAFSRLRRQKRIPAKLVNVTSGGVLNFQIATEWSMLTLVLAGVWVPRVEEPFGKQALEFITSFVSVEVKISITSTGADGRFIGDVYLPSSHDTLSVSLVQQGLADVRELEAQARSKPLYDVDKLESAKKAAVDARKGLWQAFTNDQGEHNKIVSSDNALLLRKYVEVSLKKDGDMLLIRCIRYQDYGSFRVRETFVEGANDDTDDVHRICRSMVNLFITPLKVGDHVLVFQGVNEVVRGRVRTVHDDPRLRRIFGDYELLMVDLGERRFSRNSSLSRVPPQISFSRVPPLWTEIILSFLVFPEYDLGETTAVYTFFANNFVKTFVARIDAPDLCPKVTLFTDKTNRPDDSVNWLLVREGSADVEGLEAARAWATFPQWEVVYNSLCEARDAARLDCVGIWKFLKEELPSDWTMVY